MTSVDAVIRFVWKPVLISAILGTLAVFSVVAQEAWIAPSLASAVFSQLLHPDDSGSRPIGQNLDRPQAWLPSRSRARSTRRG